MTYEGCGIYSFYSSLGHKIELTEDDIREIQQHHFPFIPTFKKNNSKNEIIELYFAYKDNFKNMTVKSLCEYIVLNVSGKKITWHAVKKQIYKYKLSQFNNFGEFIYQEMQKNKSIE
jgi:hypothetical protein